MIKIENDLMNYYEENTLYRLNPKTNYVKVNKAKFVTHNSKRLLKPRKARTS
jgi:hypothetical protein